jgi:hypothetical protein
VGTSLARHGVLATNANTNVTADAIGISSSRQSHSPGAIR